MPRPRVLRQRICYPKIHYRFGCPDGRCVGQDTPTSSEDSDTGVRQILDSMETPLSDKVKGSYSSLKENGNLKGGQADNGLQFLDKTVKRYDTSEVLLPSRTDAVGGICITDAPCKPTDHRGTAHSCSMNFNLGYRTCQYNLDIGSTLCFDSKGNLNMKHMD